VWTPIFELQECHEMHLLINLYLRQGYMALCLHDEISTSVDRWYTMILPPTERAGKCVSDTAPKPLCFSAHVYHMPLLRYRREPCCARTLSCKPVPTQRHESRVPKTRRDSDPLDFRECDCHQLMPKRRSQPIPHEPNLFFSAEGKQGPACQGYHAQEG